MAKVYTRTENGGKLQMGLSLNDMNPLDDRLVLDYEDLYITSSDTSSATLYNKAYNGMLVTVFETDGSTRLLSLKDKTPYTPGTVATVSASNYTNYWTVIGAASDASINLLETHIAKTDTSVGIIDSSISNINSSLSRINSSVNTLTNGLTVANGSIGNINSSLSRINTSIGSINSSLSKINSSVSSLETKYVTVDSSLKKLDTSLGAVYATVLDISNNIIPTIDTSISILDSSYTYLYDEVIDNELVVAAAIQELNTNTPTLNDTSTGDLEISDESGNILVRFNEGGIQTKYFDSSVSNSSINNLYDMYENVVVADGSINELYVKVDELEDTTVLVEDIVDLDNTADLDFADSSGNVIMRLVDGGVLTKKFDSSDVKKTVNVTSIFSGSVGDTFTKFTFDSLQSNNLYNLSNGIKCNVLIGSDAGASSETLILYYTYFDITNSDISTKYVTLIESVDGSTLTIGAKN